jgi:Tfp pilus assembly protein PilE
MRPTRKNYGLTLTEVLIASVILFSLLTIATQSYSASTQASRRAEVIVAALAPLPLIIDRIRYDLNQQPFEDRIGEGSMRGVKFRYRADVVDRGTPSPELATDISVSASNVDRFALYEIQLSLDFGGKALEFKYQELAW